MGNDTVQDYIDALNGIQKQSVIDFVDFMKTEFPLITPKISFSMPMWRLGEKMYDGYVAVSAAKNHFSIHFHEENYINILKEALPDCGFGKKCINIKYGDKKSIAVVKENVKDYFTRNLRSK
jgi:uncharacterized protein YdhG (YjbR/CyaY superfamily)